MSQADLARVRAIALTLSQVEEGTSFGYPAFKVDGKTFAWFPTKREVEPGSLGVRMSILERDHRVAASPETFYVTPHYRDHPAVLARVARLSHDALRELLASGHEFMAGAAGRPRARSRRTPRR